MTLIAYVIHFFMSGYAQYYYASTGFRQDNIALIIFLIPFIGGFIFIGWTALFTFFFGMMMGGFVFAGSRNNDN